jgi:hypothetical protein
VLSSATTRAEAPTTGATGRTTVIWLAALVSLQAGPIGPALLMPCLLVVGLVVSVAAVCGVGRSRASTATWASPQVAAVVLVTTGLLLAGVEQAHFAARDRPAAQAALVVGFVVLGLGACGFVGSVRLRRWAFVGFLAVSAVVQLALLAHAPAPGDVGIVGHDSVSALLHGHNPYTLTFPNPYEPARTHLFFNPEDLVGNRLDFGYAYLPVSLLGGVPGFVLGNVAYSYVAALLALTVLLHRLAVDSTGRALSLVPLAMPFTPQLLVNQWVEPIAMLCLGLCAWGWTRSRTGVAAGGLGLLLASKQYVVVALPLLWLFRRGVSLRATLGALALAAVLVGSFALLDLGAFWHSTVWLQFHLPLREDSVSIPAGWSRTFGSPPPALLGPVAILAGFAVSTLVALRGRATATSFSLGVGLSLLATVVLSEHAFSNYYALIEVALVIGCITWPLEDQRGKLSSHSVP